MFLSLYFKWLQRIVPTFLKMFLHSLPFTSVIGPCCLFLHNKQTEVWCDNIFIYFFIFLSKLKMGLGQMTPSDLVHINLTRLHHFSTMRGKFHSKIHNRFIGIHHSPPPLFPLPVYSNRPSIIIIHSSDQCILEVEQFTSFLEQSSCYIISWPSLLWPNEPNYINRLDMTRTLVFGVHFVKENFSLRTKHWSQVPLQWRFYLQRQLTVVCCLR